MKLNIKYALAVLAVIMPLLGYATDNYESNDNESLSSSDGMIVKKSNNAKNVLILNSYYSSSPVTRSLLKPVLTRVANDPNVSCKLYNLNGQLVTDSVMYDHIKETLFNSYDMDTPDYVVMIGKMAFTMRDEVKRRWGDVPILLMAQTANYAPLDYYFAGTESNCESTVKSDLSDLRDEYNFTTVVVPDYYRATIDLMVKLRPQIRSLVFASDESFLSRYEAREIRNYLLAEYPGISFKWLNANPENAIEFQRLLGTEDPTLGMLLSTWSYRRSVEGSPLSISFTELNLVFASANPVFSFNQAFMGYGSVGGVYPNMDKIQEEIGYVFDQMIEGKSMRDIPFSLNADDSVVMLDYMAMKEYGMSVKECPKDTVFVNRPVSFWEKYHWEIISIALVVFGILFLMWRHNLAQKHEILLLNRHKNFINKMPIPFSKASICFNKDHKVTNINYTLKNEAFFKLIHDNAIPDNPFLLFPADFISSKTTQLLETRQDVTFTYHFDKTDSYYDFILSLVEERYLTKKEKSEMKEIQEIDVFAVDMTDRVKMEEELKSLTKQLDFTINQGGIIPWYWDLKSDEMQFDAYSLFERRSHTFNVEHSMQAPIIEAETEFFPLVHPDDKDQLYTLREDLYAKRVDQFKTRYRLRMAKDNEDYYQWVEIRGGIYERDSDGNPLRVAGSMWCIDDDDITL